MTVSRVAHRGSEEDAVAAEVWVGTSTSPAGRSFGSSSAIFSSASDRLPLRLAAELDMDDPAAVGDGISVLDPVGASGDAEQAPKTTRLRMRTRLPCLIKSAYRRQGRPNPFLHTRLAGGKSGYQKRRTSLSAVCPHPRSDQLPSVTPFRN